MDYVIIIGQLLLSLSLLIVLHELGHFLPAKAFGTRVEKFFMFFDAWNIKLWSIKKGETEYGIGWLPLGGYVKISGMVDESLDTEALKEEPKEWEFRSKPAWQRLIVMLGGVTVNFLLGLFIFGMILFTWGEEYLPAENVTTGIYVDSIGREMGLQNGDRIISIGEVPFNRFNPGIVVREIVINSADQMKVERKGETVTLPIDEKYIRIFSSQRNKNLVIFDAAVPFVVAKALKGKPAAAAGIQQGDTLLALNGQPTPYSIEFARAIRKHKGEKVTVQIGREKGRRSFELTTTDKGLMGVAPYGYDYFFDMERKNYGLGPALQAGAKKGVKFLSDQIKAFGQMFSGKIRVTEGLGGFGTIASLFPSTWQWESFWRITAILSLILAFMNLLPIPALDGGHVLFLLYEMISGRKPSDKALEIATIIGFIIVIALVLLANGLDLYRWLIK